MRYGFTTGSCAAAAAKAASYMLLLGVEKKEITIETPKKIPYTAKILDITRTEQMVSCAVEKDGGDDPDITSGTLIYARVCYGKKETHNTEAMVCIDGGQGVGRVTRPGLDQPVGNAAINHVPREMIEKEVQEVCRFCDFVGCLMVTIYVPDGETLASKTFNPRLGIVGGISILGTSGIVEPMSSKALLETIHVELRQRKVLGASSVAISPGNYGLEFMKKAYGYDLDKSVKCSNFIGDTIDMAVDLGYEKMLLTGHIGKLIKVSGGIMNTHSKEGDCRMELLVSALLRSAEHVEELAKAILSCLTTEEALAILNKAHLIEPVMQEVMNKTMYYLNKRADGKMQIECIIYSNEYDELVRSEGAEELLWYILSEQEAEQLI